jgi:hypothetical protein
MKSWRLLYLVLFSCASQLFAASGALVPQRLLEDSSWEGAQIVSADRAGNVFFFRGDAFEVYPLTKKGTLGEPIRLKTNKPPSQMVHDAVLSPDGREWLVYGDVSVRLFEDGREKTLTPIPWKPWAIGFVRDRPVVAVVPLPMGGRSVNVEKLGTPPWLLRFDDDRWSRVLDMKGVTVPEVLRGGKLNEVIAERSVYLASDQRGRLWTAGQYRYRVQRFSPGFRPSLEIVMDGGKVRKKEQPGQAIQIQRRPQANPREATKDAQKERPSSYHPFTADAVILDLTEGRDGRIYFLASTAEGKAALDRFDPGLSILERIPLQLKTEGRFTMASGKDGLYWAAWNGTQGRWHIRWDVLEQAEWREVDGYEIDGLSPEDRATNTADTDR